MAKKPDKLQQLRENDRLGAPTPAARPAGAFGGIRPGDPGHPFEAADHPDARTPLDHEHRNVPPMPEARGDGGIQQSKRGRAYAKNLRGEAVHGTAGSFRDESLDAPDVTTIEEDDEEV